MTNKPAMTTFPSPNYGYPTGIKGRNGTKVQALVLHVMAGTLAGTDSWFASKQSGVSAHYGIGKAGEIHEYVSPDNVAWANGIMDKPDLSIPWLRECWDQNRNPNLCTISIEHEGIHAQGAFWAPTEAQYTASLALCRWLCERYGIPADADHIVGHNRLDGVNRPNCPGPGWPWQRLFTDMALASAPSDAVTVVIGVTGVPGDYRLVDGRTVGPVGPLVDELVKCGYQKVWLQSTKTLTLLPPMTGGTGKPGTFKQ